MKKMIMISFIVFFITGCSTNYNIDLVDDKIIEYMDVSVQKNILNSDSELKNTIDSYYNDLPKMLDDLKKYSSADFSYNKINDDTYYGFSYRREYTFDKYYSSPLIYQCYTDSDVTREDNLLSISISGESNCFNAYKWLDEVNINLKTKYYVLSNNADRVDGYTYTWVINRNNYRNKDISVNIDLSSKSQFTLNSEQSNKVFSTALIIIGVVVLVGGCFVGIKVFKSNR